MVMSYATLKLGNEINKIFLACPCLNTVSIWQKKYPEKVSFDFITFCYIICRVLPVHRKKRKDGNRKTRIPRQHGDLTTLNYLSSDNGKIRELLEKWKKEITIACYHVGYHLPRNEKTHIISEDRPIRLVKMTQIF